MAQTWNVSDPDMHWDIERELRIMLDGKEIKFYKGTFLGKVESIYINPDGIADVDMYGKINNYPKYHYRLRLRLNADGSFTIQNCYNKESR